jgi:IS5 family transposase
MKILVDTNGNLRKPLQEAKKYDIMKEKRKWCNKMGQIILFGAETQLEKLSKMGDQLEKMKEKINWELFRFPLEAAIRKPNYSKGGRPAWDVVLMYKIVMLQQWYNLSDESTEYMINCRLDFMRFLDIECGAKVPDENTIWDFKQALSETGVDRELFDLFNAELTKEGIITRKGSIIDATFVTVDKRHTSKKDDQSLKEGDCPHDLHAKCAERLENGEIKDDVHVFRQLDFDARWTKKNNESYFGYKDHVKCDRESKIITDFTVTDASVHDSQELIELVNQDDNSVDLDSGYVGEDIKKEVLEKCPDIELNICARAYRNRPLTDEEKAVNKIISSRRCRIEHIFGYMTRFMGGLTIRCHGIKRAYRDICNKNLAYNLKRYVCITG